MPGAPGQARARVAQARRARGMGVDVGDQQVLGELRCAGDDGAVVVEDRAGAVEDQLVLAADQRAERKRGEVVAGALLEHRLALGGLAGLVRGGGEVDDDLGARQRLVDERPVGDPVVLADRQPDRDAVDLDDRRLDAGLEVADLVEDAVVGQAHLAVDALDVAVGQDGERVVDVVVALGEADQRDDAVGILGQPVDGGARVAQEVLLEQQVLRRVAGDRQLGERDELCAGLLGAGDAVADRGFVAGEIADGGVELAQGEAQRLESTRSGGRAVLGVGTAVGRWRGPVRPTRSSAAGSRGEVVDRAFEVLGDLLEVGQRVEVGEQAEAQPAVVGHDRDAERLVLGQRHDGVEAAHAPAEQEELQLRARARW